MRPADDQDKARAMFWQRSVRLCLGQRATWDAYLCPALAIGVKQQRLFSLLCL